MTVFKTRWDLSLAATVAFWLGFMVAQALATPPIALKVDPRQGFEPITVRATVSIEPNYLNTTVCLSWESLEGMSGLSCRILEGQYAPRTHYFEARSLTAGNYMFQAAVYQGQTWVRSTGMNVNIVPRN